MFSQLGRVLPPEEAGASPFPPRRTTIVWGGEGGPGNLASRALDSCQVPVQLLSAQLQPPGGQRAELGARVSGV